MARFIVSSRHFSSEGGYVKAAAFLPSPRDNSTSVFRTSGLNDEAVWRIGEEQVSDPLKKTLYGRGQVLVGFVVECGLRVEPKEPPARHAEILGWSSGKDEQKSIAQRLAAGARFVSKPGTVRL